MDKNLKHMSTSAGLVKWQYLNLACNPSQSLDGGFLHLTLYLCIMCCSICKCISKGLWDLHSIRAKHILCSYSVAPTIAWVLTYLKHWFKNTSVRDVSADLNVGQFPALARLADATHLREVRESLGQHVQPLEHDVVGLEAAHVDAAIERGALITWLSGCGLILEWNDWLIFPQRKTLP